MQYLVRGKSAAVGTARVRVECLEAIAVFADAALPMLAHAVSSCRPYGLMVRSTTGPSSPDGNGSSSFVQCFQVANVNLPEGLGLPSRTN